MKFSVVAALPYYWLLLGGGIVIDRAPRPVEAQFDYYDSTTYAVLLPQARGKIPNAYGPVKARVSTTRQLSVQFNLLAGTGYVAGNVTATTNPRGQVVQLAKGKQTCKIQYNSTGTVLRVTCTTRVRRDLGGVANDPDEADRDPNSLSVTDGAATAEGESQLPSERRLGPSCGACTSVVSSALTTGIRSICGGTPFARAVPAPYRWAKAAATAMCAMRTTLGNPLHVAYGTCRCPCFGFDPEVCPSRVCLLSTGLCMAEKLRIGALCRYSSDCVNEVCAQRKWSSTGQVCCPSNDTYSVGIGGFIRFCTEGDELGDVCSTADGCKSGNCVRAVCTTERLGSGETCFDNDDCANGMCYYSIFPSDGLDNKICCPSNTTSTFGSPYCSEISDVGQRCHHNSLCKSGICSRDICLAQKLEINASCPDMEDADCLNGACGQKKFSPIYVPDQYICCPSNATSWGYCTETTELGDACGTNKACKSGICSNQTCVAQRHDVGQPCPDREDDDCLNGACGRASYPDGAYVCCPSNNRTGPDWMERYCTAAQALGEPCGQNQQCISGVCSNNTCIVQRYATGQECPDGEDDDCQNGVCGLASYPDGVYVCCPSNSSTGIYENIYRQYCDAMLGLGERCGRHAQCASGVCSNQTCIPQWRATGQPCTVNYGEDDCQNGACGRESYPNGPYVCCPTNNRTVAVWNYNYEYYCAPTQGLGSACSANPQCFSGVCSNRTCIAQRRDVGQPCPDGEDDDCRNGVACGRASYYPEGPYVCCPTLNRTGQYCDSTQAVGKRCSATVQCIGSGGGNVVCLRGRCRNV